MFSVHYNIGNEELDSQYQHLHHASSLKYLERGRLDLLVAIGFPSASLIAQGLFPVVKELSVKYLREIRSEVISVTCEAPSVDGKEFALHQRIINARGKDAIIGVVVLALLSSHVKRAVEPPEEFVSALMTINNELK